MKFIARYINLIGLVLLVSFAGAAAALYFDAPQKINASRSKSTTPAFACPMHPHITASTAMECSECGMKLVALADLAAATRTVGGSGCCNKPATPPAPAATPTSTGCPHLDTAPKPGRGSGCSHH